MTNPEEIFSHLPPADRPPVAEKSEFHLSDRDEFLARVAEKAMILMPPLDTKERRTHYTDFDRAAFIVDEAKKHEITIEHEDAVRAMDDADERIVQRKQAEKNLRMDTEEWQSGESRQKGPSDQDRRDLLKLRLDDTISPHDILPEQPNQEESND